MLKDAGDARIVDGDGWAANVDFIVRALAHTRRVETLTLPSRYDVRPRESRIRPITHALSLWRYGRSARRRAGAAAAT
jgi:hypothetical protein